MNIRLIFCCLFIINFIGLNTKAHPDDLTLNLNMDYKKRLITLGNLSINYLDNYEVKVFDGINYKSQRLIESNSKLYLNINYFNKNKYFNGADSSYTTDNYMHLDNYINGTSNDMSRFYGIFRKNVINNIRIAERFALSEYEPLNIQFKRQICLIDNDYVFIITVTNYNVEQIFLKEIPEYFVDGSDYVTPREGEKIYRWSNRISVLYDKYKNYEVLPTCIENLFIETNEIINSINIK
jgi:glycogen debranching enzyme